MKTILVASNSFDVVNTQPVIDILQQRGCEVISYYADKVASGEAPFSYEIHADGSVDWMYEGRKLEPEHIAAAWSRRPNIFDLTEKDRAKLRLIDEERKECQEGFWRTIPANRWLNAPHMMQAANNKFQQLRVARQIGFNVPPTVVSNTWSEIFDRLPGDEVLLKMPDGRLVVDNVDRRFKTTVIKNQNNAALAKSLPFPGIWQPFIPKKKEWRVTVVGERVFAAAIHTAEKARTDWREHQFDDSLVQFQVEPFPEDLQQKCITMLKELGLRYGAFDFVETPKGEVYFLEVNVNGQYQWLVDTLGLAIPEAIASELLQIAEAG